MDALPLFPLNTVLFPSMPLSLHIFEDRYKQMIARCLAEKVAFGVLLIREGSEVGAPAVPVEIGTTAQIVGVDKLKEGRLNLVAVGRKRFRLIEITQQLPYLVGRVEFVPHHFGDRERVAAAVATVRDLFGEYVQLAARMIDAELNAAHLPGDAAGLAYTVAAALQIENQGRQHLLEAASVEQILNAEARMLPKETARLRMLAEFKIQRKEAEKAKIGPFSMN